MANSRHPKMDRANRAKQFMPFDALKGFREELAKRERIAEAVRDYAKESGKTTGQPEPYLGQTPDK